MPHCSSWCCCDVIVTSPRQTDVSTSALFNAFDHTLPRWCRQCLRRFSACEMASTPSSPRTRSRTRGKGVTPTQQEPMNHRCAKFKTKPLEHLDLMERVFAGAATTGKHMWTPTEIRDADGTSDSAATLDSGMGPLSGGTPPRDVLDCVGDNVVDCSLFDNAPPHSTADGSANAKCCKRVAPGKGENTVGDCLAKLMMVPGLYGGGSLFSFTCLLMDSPDKRNLIMGLPLDYVVNWLKRSV
ncbi:hypothetical protein TEA_025109 [Camellia sinensis var. sinensis]|uniref:Uncharacterized protein n=1 Tax=Camellia sinensis var. sinensis TaxID=542762 RepID=A0A4S4EF13_CAMSN|nr:hypothetical protein TEA_025109 [Camellia sinensis var. sinensis]